MNNIIKCPICHEISGLRYNENRVYQSRCQNMACRETVTVTAPSEAVAEELFSKFEKGTSQPKLSIPKKIAEELDKVPFHNPIAQLSNKDCDLTDFNDTVKRYAWNNKENGYICVAYLAGKALGVELVEVTDE